MSRGAVEWIRRAVPASPPRLLSAMTDAVDSSSAEAIPEALAEAAVELYSRVVDGDGTRANALALLAADALLTHAFQAQAEIDPSGLATFTARWSGADQLAGILP